MCRRLGRQPSLPMLPSFHHFPSLLFLLQFFHSILLSIPLFSSLFDSGSTDISVIISKSTLLFSCICVCYLSLQFLPLSFLSCTHAACLSFYPFSCTLFAIPLFVCSHSFCPSLQLFSILSRLFYQCVVLDSSDRNCNDSFFIIFYTIMYER